MGGPGFPRNRFLTFELRPVRGVIASRELDFWVVALRGGGTSVRVDAQDVWIVPRPASERLPAGVGGVDVTSTWRRKPPIVSMRVTAPDKVDRIVALINGMQTVQPGVTLSCAMLRPGQPAVTFNFRAHRGGPLVAKATLTDYGFPSGPCNPVNLTIHAHRQSPLVGGNFLANVQRLLGVNFR